MSNTRLNRNILVTACTALLISGIAIDPASAIVRTEPGLIDPIRNQDCVPHGNTAIPAIRLAPAGRIPLRAPVGVPLNSELNDRIG